jgi:IS30 family transposase
LAEAGIHLVWFYNKLTMSNKYHRLCAGERIVIANMRQAGKNQIEIAQAIGSSQSTISKELARNCGERGYRPAQANRLAMERKIQKRTRPKVMVGIIKDEVEARLRIKHSPDQISNSLALKGLKVSHETIYQHLVDDRKAGGDLSLNLRINGKRRYRRRSKIGRGEKIPNRVDIEERPMIISGRNRYGDWEADLIQGAAGSGFLLSIHERKSRVGKLHLLPDKSSAETMQGIITALNGLKVNSITYDNGLEFAMHERINDLLECKSYFCKPYRSWEKGGVENYNGLVRQYFPKGHDFATITLERLIEVEEEINNRPRNILAYQSPNDLLDHLRASCAPSPGGFRGTARFHFRARYARPCVPSRRSAKGSTKPYTKPEGITPPLDIP